MVVLQVHELAIGYGGQQVFEAASFHLAAGERVGLVGPNGCGKSTLLEILAGRVAPDRGQVRWIPAAISVGYVPQVPLWEPEIPLGEQLGPVPPELLARWGLDRQLLRRPAGKLSGGQKTRAALARAFAGEPPVLLLDEPTNHLDMASREALESAIKDFPGTLLFASHDRYFIDTLATHLWIWQDGVIHVFKGSYSEYRAKVENGEDILFEEDLPSFVLRRRGSGSPASVGRRDGSMDPGQGPGRGASPEQGSRARGKARPHENDKAADDKDERQKEAALRKALILELSRLESEIEALELRREELIRVFSDPSSYESPESLPWKEYDSIEKELQLLYGKWEALVDQVAGTSEDKEKTSSQA